MHKVFRYAAAAAVAAALTTTPTATAEPALAAPGAPVATLFEGSDSFANTSRCSQGPAGVVRTPDGQTKQIMVTAAHCFDVQDKKVRPEVYAPVRQGNAVRYPHVGTIDVQRKEFQLGNGELMDFYRIIDEPDWAMVRLDPGVSASGWSTSRDQWGATTSPNVAITGVKDYRSLGHELISFDNFGQPICKDGMRTGRSCGTQVFRTQNFIWHVGLDYASGDSGGINYDPRTGEAIGLTVIGFGPFGNSQQVDRALESAYGIPDGQVNQAFTPAKPAPRAEFATLRDEIAQHNPTAAKKPAPAPSKFHKLTGAVHNAQSDAARFAGEAQRLPQAQNPVAAAQDLAGRASAAANQHAGEISAAVNAIIR